MEREVGGGIGMGNTCKPMAVSFQCMTKSTTNKKKKKKKNNTCNTLLQIGDNINHLCNYTFSAASFVFEALTY